ncbi:MAG: ATP-binding protein [Rhodothermales bacterium]|nr:ATP-binding protein [Rhodothermales bacterium]
MIVIKVRTPNCLVLECPSDLGNLDALVDETGAFVEEIGLDEELAYKIVLLMSEAATNAITHGNAEDPAKKVDIELRCAPRQIALIVEDEGEGFNLDEIEDPISAENLMRGGGRGLFFIREMAEEVHLENNGRRIRMIFHVP